MEEYLAALDAELRSIIVSPNPKYEAYYGMFKYHLGWVDIHFQTVHSDAGKRIRPLLCMFACEAVCGDWQRALPVAAAIELVHNFSLIHDDIEDQSDERRGRTAVWKAWGLAQGLNAGDGMFMLARLALDRMAPRGLAVIKCAAINEEFDSTTLALCHGQFLDLGFESQMDVTVDEYMQMIRGKTAALIAASLRLGAMLGTDDPALVDAFGRFGESAGLAFQVVDDILGIWGDPAVTGKSAASDILSKKKSLPAILGMHHAQFGKRLREIYALPQLQTAHVAEVLELLDAAQVRQQVERQADTLTANALAALHSTQIKNRAMDQLRGIAETMTRRVR
jgi:geranylgeranyl diphosphate synthase type I